jgi:hypothetical protein
MAGQVVVGGKWHGGLGRSTPNRPAADISDLDGRRSAVHRSFEGDA